MEVIEKEQPKKEYDLPQSLKSTIDKFSFSWVMQDYLNDLIREYVGDENIEAESFNYVVGSASTKFLVREDFSYVSHEYKRGGFPVRYYSVEVDEQGSKTYELKGFVFITKDDLDDISTLGGNIEDMAQLVITTEYEDINFNLMVQTF